MGVRASKKVGAPSPQDEASSSSSDAWAPHPDRKVDFVLSLQEIPPALITLVRTGNLSDGRQ